MLWKVTGVLRFIADRGRPDILAALGEISSGGHPHPSPEHVTVAKQLCNFVKSTKKNFMQIGGKETYPELFGFADASFVADGDSLSRLGGCLYWGTWSGAFHSFSTRATVVAHSPMDAEMMSMDKLIKDITFYKEILRFLRQDVKKNDNNLRGCKKCC